MSVLTILFADYPSRGSEPGLEAKKTSSCFPQNFIFMLDLGKYLPVLCLIWGAKLIIISLDGAGVAKPRTIMCKSANLLMQK